MPLQDVGQWEIQILAGSESGNIVPAAFVLVIAIALWLTGFTLLWIERSLLWAVGGAIAAFLLSVALTTLRIIFLSPLSPLFAPFRRHEDHEKNSN
jgi:hypothetical protein